MRHACESMHYAFLKVAAVLALALLPAMLLLLVASTPAIGLRSLAGEASAPADGALSANANHTFPFAPKPIDLLPVARSADEILFQDQFHGGTPDLEWKPFPHFNMDNLRGSEEPSPHGGEPGVGVLTNENVGGFAALSYVERAVPADFVLEAWLHTMVASEDNGQLNGVAFRVDPVGQRFYRVASEFTSNPVLTLAYIGSDTNNFPVYLRSWRGDEIPGGAPAASDWHRLRIEVAGGVAEVYWDGVKLPGGPFPLDRSETGFVGVYANFVGGLGHAETMVDDFTVRQLSKAPAPD